MRFGIGLVVFAIVLGAVGLATADPGTGAELKDGYAVLADNVKIILALAAGFGLALAALGGTFGQAKAVAAAVEGIARNPEAAQKIQTAMILGLALIESLVLVTFLMAYLLQGKI